MVKQLELYIPSLEDLWFYQKMITDPATMAYNANYDIDFPGYNRDTGCITHTDTYLKDWYLQWIGQEPQYFYAYVQRSFDKAWLGGVNFHYVAEKDWWDMGIVLYEPYRGKGYAIPALEALIERAFFHCHVTRIHNYFEFNRQEAVKIHHKLGFREMKSEDDLCHLLLTKEEYLQRKQCCSCDAAQ